MDLIFFLNIGWLFLLYNSKTLSKNITNSPLSILDFELNQFKVFVWRFLYILTYCFEGGEWKVSFIHCSPTGVFFRTNPCESPKFYKICKTNTKPLIRVISECFTIGYEFEQSHNLMIVNDMKINDSLRMFFVAERVFFSNMFAGLNTIVLWTVIIYQRNLIYSYKFKTVQSNLFFDYTFKETREKSKYYTIAFFDYFFHWHNQHQSNHLYPREQV